MENNNRKIKITYKVKVITDKKRYFLLTNKLFNESFKKYFELLVQNENLLEFPRNKCIQQLEKLTVMTRSGPRGGEVPRYYFEQNLPVRFRRAAISNAIGCAKIYFYNNKRNKNNTLSYIKLNVPTLFYKKTYRYSESGLVEFQLFNGEKWDWYVAKLCNWENIKGEKKLSPKIAIQNNCIMAHIPIEKDVEELTQQEVKKEKNLKVCGVVFTNTDNFAVCVALDDRGNLIKSKFISGGNKYVSTVKRILGKIRKNNRNLTSGNDYKKYWEKIIRINKYNAHYVSKKIIEFCKENGIKVISVTESSDTETISIPKYRHIKNVSTPIELSKKIMEYLDYKSNIEKILIIKSYINAYNKCYKCFKPIKKVENDNLKVICEDGHRSDYYFNVAMNIAKTCLRKLGKRV